MFVLQGVESRTAIKKNILKMQLEKGQYCMLHCFVLIRKCQENNLWTPSHFSHHPIILVLLAVAVAGGCVLAGRKTSHPQPRSLPPRSLTDTFCFSCCAPRLKWIWMFTLTQMTSSYTSQGWAQACSWSDGAFGVNMKDALSPRKSLHCACTVPQTSGS